MIFLYELYCCLKKIQTLNIFFQISEQNLNPPMARAKGVDATPNRFLCFFSKMGGSFLETKVLPVGSYLSHLSIKRRFSSRTYHLDSKTRQRVGALLILTMKMTSNLLELVRTWYRTGWNLIKLIP